jgi:DNA polymerase
VNRGGCDLKVAGTWRYAADPATEILCLGFRHAGIDRSWAPADGLLPELVRLAADSGATFISFAGFEAVVWQLIMVKRFRFPPIETARWIDLRAVCSGLALPRKLDKLLPVIGADIEKDTAGQRLVLSLSRPNRKGIYPELTPDIRARVCEYNRKDVAALECIYATIPAMPAAERKVWELDQRINARGIAIDLDFVRAAKAIADQVTSEAMTEFAALTDGLSPHQVQATMNWVARHGLAIANLQAETIDDTLERPELEDNVRRVLEIRKLVAPSSLAKLDAMLACTRADGRARGLLSYHAAHTGRWAGALVQPQNLPRPTLDTTPDPEELVRAVKAGDIDALRSWGSAIDVLVSGLRHALWGDVLGAGDFAAIECCVLLALAGQHDKCKLIADGVDVYRDMAATIYGLDRDAFLAIPEEDLTTEQSEQRRIGKSSVLGCGYQMGAETFYRRYCKRGTADKDLASKTVMAYRTAWAPGVPKLWRDLEATARHALTDPGRVKVAACGIAYCLTTRAGMPCLVCTLLNGKELHYNNATVTGVGLWGRARWSYFMYHQGRWCEVEPYGGQLAENVVSALSRELLVDRMFALEDAGFPIVLTVHDEIVVEHPGVSKDAMESIMSVRPSWAEKLGVPVRAKCWIGRRYRK